MPAPPGDPPRAPRPPRPTSPGGQQAQAQASIRKIERGLAGPRSETSSNGITSVSQSFSGDGLTGGIASGPVPASSYSGWAQTAASVKLGGGGALPSGRYVIAIDDGSGGSQGYFPNAGSEPDVGCTTHGQGGASTMTVTAGFEADDEAADMTGLTLNVNVRSEVRL